jgi:hypothetical protein
MVLKGVEEAAARALAKLFEDLKRPTTWNPGPDPPDLEFEIDGDGRWGVEVTELHQYFEKAGAEESRAAVDRPLIHMCERIRSQVKDQENSHYLLSVNGPIETPSPREIEERAVRYIRSGSREEQVLDEKGLVRIRAITSPVRVSYLVGLDPEARNADGLTLTANIRATLEYALNRVLAEKLPILRELSEYDRRVLLIWSQYLFAEPPLVKEILETKGLTKDQLDCILLVADGKIHWVADPAGVFNLRTDGSF